MSQISGRHIEFDVSEVRSILDGRKTQFRHVVRPQPYHLPHRACCANERHWDTWRSTQDAGQWKCPHGLPGDRLRVKEPWMLAVEDPEGREFYYAATDPQPVLDDGNGFAATDRRGRERLARWRSAYCMPYHACRLKLEITRVWMERLQEIDAADALAEGVDLPELPGCSGEPKFPSDYETWPEAKRERWIAGTARAIYLARCADAQNHVDAFAKRWDSWHRLNTWASNPFVWVVEFKPLPRD